MQLQIVQFLMRTVAIIHTTSVTDKLLTIHLTRFMCGNSLAGTENGEILYYNLYRLGQEDLFLDGKNVEITLPIGKQQATDTLAHDPQTGELLKPEQ